MVWPDGERLKRWRERRAEARHEAERKEEEVKEEFLETGRGGEPSPPTEITRKESPYEKMKKFAAEKGEEERQARERKELAEIEKRQRELEKLKKQEQQWKEIAEIRSYREKIQRHKAAARPRGRYGGGGFFKQLGGLGVVGHQMLGVPAGGGKKGSAPQQPRQRIDFFGGMAAPKQPIVGGISAPKQPVVGIGGVSKAPTHPIISLWGPPKKKKSGG